MEQAVEWWVVSSYLGDALTGGGMARESFRLSAGAAITTKVQKVPKVPCEGRRSKVRKQSLAQQPEPNTVWAPMAVLLLLVFINLSETHFSVYVSGYVH